MHVDSRNPQTFEPDIYSHPVGYCVSVMSPCPGGEWVSYAAYQDLKGKLENLERKYKKLKKRHMDVSRKFREADTKAYLLGFNHGWNGKTK